jgi:hypothetical protein
MFEVVIGMKDVGKSESFKKAFKLFWEAVKKQLEDGTTWQALETADFLVYVKKNTKLAIGFYDARDLAYKCGLLRDSDFQEDAPEPNPDLVEAEFIAYSVEDVLKMLEGISL